MKVIGNSSAGCLVANPLIRPSAQLLVNDLKFAQLLLGFDYVKRLADNGDALCQCQVGLCYLIGSGEDVTITYGDLLSSYNWVIATNLLHDVRVVCESSPVESS